MFVVKVLFSILLSVPLCVLAYYFLTKLVEELYKNGR